MLFLFSVNFPAIFIVLFGTLFIFTFLSVHFLSSPIIFIFSSCSSTTVGDASEPVTKVLWLNTDSNPLIVFSGGLPSEEASEHHTVTVLQGTEHVALDFSSSVLDFVAVTG